MKNPKSQIPSSKKIPSSKSPIGNACQAQRTFWSLGFGGFLGFGVWCLGFSCALAQGTSFTYQGRLSDSSGPVNGNYDFTFQIFDAPSGGASQVEQLATNGVSIAS